MKELRKSPGPRIRAGRHTVLGRRSAAHLIQVHPLPRRRERVLSVTVQLLHEHAARQGKDTPALSENAAAFLLGRRWVSGDLIERVWRAVTLNDGSLITAADLGGA